MLFEQRLSESLDNIQFHPGARQEYAAFYDENGQRIGKEYHGNEKEVKIKIPQNEKDIYDGTWLIHNHVDPSNPRMKALPIPSHEDIESLKGLLDNINLKGIRIISSMGETTLEIKDPKQIASMNINLNEKDPEKTLKKLEQYFKIEKDWDSSDL